MKPIKLIISAWGSYPEREEIDFAKFYNKNLFLITGATGAGKTTIFDAISFALYGNVSGKIREKATIRSDFAMPNVDTFVELTMIHKGILYEIRRTPKYKRPKKRGDGDTISIETAELRCDGMEPITVINDVNNKLKEIMGINYEQFKQITMIAQGEFLELLLSGSKERVEILRNLFKTGQYERIQNALSEKSKKLLEERKELMDKANQAVAMVDLSEKNEDYESICKTIENMIEEIRTYIEKTEIDLENIDKESKRLIIELTKGKKQNEVIEHYERVNKELAILLEKKEDIIKQEFIKNRAIKANKVFVEEKLYISTKERSKKQREKIEAIEKEYEGLKIKNLEVEKEVNINKELEEEVKIKIKKKDELNNYLPIFIKLDKEIINFKECSEKYEVSRNISEKLEKEIIDLRNKEELEKKEKDRYVDIDKKLLDVNNQIEHLQNNLVTIRKIKIEQEEILEETKQLTTLQLEYNKVKIKKDECRELYEEKEAMCRDAAVGLVASYLEKGKPCPVCGSLEHPCKARVSEEVPNEEELSRLKEKMNNTSVEFENIYQKTATKSGLLKEKCRTHSKVLEENNLKEDEVVKREEDIIKKEKQIIKEKKELEKDKSRNEEVKFNLEKIIREREEKIKKAEENAKEEMELLSDKKAKEQNITTIKEQLPDKLSGLNEIKEIIKKVEKEIVDMNDIIEAVRKKAERIGKDLASKSALISDNRKQLLQLEEEEKEEKKKYENDIKLNGFLTEDDYKKAIMTETKINEMEKNIDSYNEEYKKSESEKLILESEIKNSKKINITELEEKLKEVEQTQKVLRKEREESISKQNNNKRSLDVIKEKSKLIIDIEKEYGVYSQLDKVSKGNNKERLVFEQYVLGTYFEEIINAANLRLVVMTNERYKLLRVLGVTDARTKDSLDLEVLDNYTGKRRSVKTLSGGESFKAALSLALGLSDIVQNYSGGIEIETLFIDEGFGSLDGESLDVALNTLTSLSGKNRFIGIVSHVNELKERIDNQIVVEKKNTGSYIRA